MTIYDLIEYLNNYDLEDNVVLDCGEGVYYTPARLYMNLEGDLVISSEEGPDV